MPELARVDSEEGRGCCLRVALLAFLDIKHGAPQWLSLIGPALLYMVGFCMGWGFAVEGLMGRTGVMVHVFYGFGKGWVTVGEGFDCGVWN